MARASHRPDPRRRRFAVALVVSVVACAGWHSGRAGSAPPLYTPEELMFLTHMIVHHQQALDMAALVPARSQREEFVRFARYVDGSQRSEIDQMQALLKLAAERGTEIAQHEMTGDPPMAGMLSRAQMAALAAAQGPEFERLWLEGMIYHHQGALDMGRELQQEEFTAGRQPFGLDTLVDDILVVQRMEIAKMKSWLVQWNLEAR
jgi:uncharacterized protein (DUF305 family)